ncbi:glutamate--tRNA ligase [Patescibacteria group bacterium]|nr:glutamate--tRNA ligase [Patescibacteria group bacterium]MCL5010099.1 glutamate--tRNA ligase [Patescibacteria group bacterium]
MPTAVRTRIAPSPTGIPHIGNTRTALFDYLFARHNKGAFILRIEDTDQSRKAPGAQEAIEEILNWLGLIPDEKYIQSERLDLYRKKTDELIEKGFAKKDEGAVRFIVPKERTISWTDAVGNKKISFNSNDIEDFIILKSDGFPTYHLASVVDDSEMRISHVVRGEEWISSTPKHLLLYEAFGFRPPVFVHLPVILGTDRAKLSKRHGAKSALDYKHEGYLKEALLNYMALLGWSPGQDKEIMSMEEMISLFDLKDINTASPVFDPVKLTWMNGVYIRKTQNSRLKTQILAQNPKLKEINARLLEAFVPLAKDRMKTLNDFPELVMPFLNEPKIDLSNTEKSMAKDLYQALSKVSAWKEEAILAVLRQILKEKKIKMNIIYKIITGSQQGLPLPKALEILEKAEVLRRLKAIA